MRSSRRMPAAKLVRGSPAPLTLLAAGWLAVLAVSGCESLQRKFARKAKQPARAPEPIFQFQDYSRAITPLDRYRKHYLMFQYWNSELADALGRPPLQGKRFRRASAESLAELEALKGLLAEDAATQLDPILEERRAIDRRLQNSAFMESQATAVVRQLDLQTRAIQHQFFWRDIEDHVRPDTGGGG